MRTSDKTTFTIAPGCTCMENTMSGIFKLFSNILPVRGATRSTLCDLQRGRIKLIPNTLYDILIEFRDQPLDTIKSAHDAEDHKCIEDYFDYLLSNEWGFICQDPHLFPPLDLSYDVPAHITNAIIDVDRESDHDFVFIRNQLENLGCGALQIRVFSPVNLTWLASVLEVFESSKLRNLEIWIPHHTSLVTKSLLTLIQDHPRLYRLIIHHSPNPEVLASGKSPNMGLLVRIGQCIDSKDHCGHVDRSYFISGLYNFAEAKHFNSCLNRKIAIDTKGYLRNCPSMATHWGLASEVDWRQLVTQPEFQAIWQVTKDQVEVCKDCEFRYVCTDCRAYTRDNDPLGKPKKCHYDPYTAKWQAHTEPAFMPV